MATIAVFQIYPLRLRHSRICREARRVRQPCSKSGPMENNPPPSMAGVEGFPRDAALTGSRYAETAHGEPRQLAQSFIIPARTGKAFPLIAGKIVRVSCVEGPQVADMIVFNLHDPNEKFWSGRTRVIHGGHLKVGD